MTMLSKNKSVRALLFVLAHGAAIALIYFGVVSPILAMKEDLLTEIEEKNNLLIKMQDTYARVSNQGQIENQTGSSGYYFLGENEGAINAQLLGKLKEAVETSGASIRSVRSLQTRSFDKLKMPGARIEIAGDIGGLAKAIYNIEFMTAPVLFISNSILRGPPGAGGGPDSAPPPQLEGQFDVYGVWLERGDKL